MDTSATNRRLRVLLTAIRDGTLIPRPEFQRRLVWTTKDKVRFLDTVLSGYPFPEIYIAAGDVDLRTGQGTELLVDGQQRITTLYQYFNGASDLRLGGSVPPYAELAPERQARFLEYSVVVRDLGALSLPEIKKVFERINATAYSLNAMEIHNARFNGAFKQFGEEVAREGFWEEHRVFSQNEIRRMDDLRFVLTFVITIMSTYFNRDDEIEDYLRTYNDAFDDRDAVLGEVRRVLAFVDRCDLDPKSRAWKRSDLLTLLVELHRALEKDKLPLDPAETGRRLNAFYDQVDHREQIPEQDERRRDLDSYYKAAVQANQDKGNRVRRGEILRKALVGGDRPLDNSVPRR